jgi:N-acetylneuraminic acid mutarotase
LGEFFEQFCLLLRGHANAGIGDGELDKAAAIAPPACRKLDLARFGELARIGVGWRGRNTPAHEVYDPAANSWTALAYVPTARDHLAVAAMDGRLYAVGGRVDGSYLRNLTSNEAYDPATGRWEQRAPLPTARSGIAAAVLEGRMFVFGGEAPAGTFNQVESYDAKSNGWSSHPRMPTARHGLGAVAVAGRIYVISGGPTPGDSVSAANEIFVP